MEGTDTPEVEEDSACILGKAEQHGYQRANGKRGVHRGCPFFP